MGLTPPKTAAALLLWAGNAAAELPCGTPEHLLEITAAPRPAHIPPPDDHLIDRDSFSPDAQRYLSAHFAVKWGTTDPLSEAQAASMANALEMTLDAQVTDWDMPDPTGTGGTLFNVYIGDTGDEVPSVMGNAGYFTIDSEGYPYIVLNSRLVDDEAYALSVVRHEFFHAVQWATEAFSTTMSQLWYWEATACWATGHLAPEHHHFFYFLPWYALRPTTALEHHSIDDYGGEPPDLHQYGAFILPWYIGEHIDPEIVLASWREGTATEDPLNALNTELGDIEIEDVIADHAAANLTWDYALGANFQAHMMSMESTYAHRDTRYTTAVADEDDWWGPEAAEPDCYGYHFVQMPAEMLERVQMGLDVAIALEPDIPEGLPSSLSFHGRLVEIEGDTATSHFIDHDADQTYVSLSPTSDELWLAVANTTSPHALRETPAYRFRWVPMPEPEDTGAPDTGDDEDTASPEPSGTDSGETHTPNFRTGKLSGSPDGCSCTTGGAHGILWLAPFLLARRRGDSKSM